ncbi:hypothetical protein ACFXA3_10510 [Streptomyces sp. NPDC059456]|uniref:hypothetical protein n=1 Tax=Streptomyces sp. NPDC059456 TaxID=3346838 RepID=UPI003696CC93
MPRDAVFVRTGWSRRWLDGALALWVIGFLGVALAAQGGQQLRNGEASHTLRTEPGRPGPVQLAEDGLYLIWIESRTDMPRPPVLQAVMTGAARKKPDSMVSVTSADGHPVGQDAFRRSSLGDSVDHRYWYADERGHWQAWPTATAQLKPGNYTLDTPLNGPGIRLAIEKMPAVPADHQSRYLALAGAGAALYLFSTLRRRGINRRALGPNAAVLAG